MSALDKDDIGTWTKNGFMSGDSSEDFKRHWLCDNSIDFMKIEELILVFKRHESVHVDIMTAFLYAELKEPIEIGLPEGLEEEHPGCIGLLLRQSNLDRFFQFCIEECCHDVNMMQKPAFRCGDANVF
jgi:hypothetical protein